MLMGLISGACLCLTGAETVLNETGGPADVEAVLRQIRGNLQSLTLAIVEDIERHRVEDEAKATTDDGVRGYI
jgi:hypothetical protein